MKDNKLNGSVNTLAVAMCQVFAEAAEVANEPIKESLDGLRNDMKSMEGRLSERIDTTNKNMSAQFVEQEKKIGKLIKEQR